MSPQRESLDVMRQQVFPPPLQIGSSLSSCPHGCALCGLPLNYTILIIPSLIVAILLWPYHPIKSRFLHWWGHECSRSALDSFDNKVLPVLSTHSGSHGCEFDCVFTKSYKWPDNMWTVRIFRQHSFLSVQKIWHEQHLKTVWPSVEDEDRTFFFKPYFISLNLSRFIFPFVAWLRDVWQGAKRVKQVQRGKVPSSQLWK